MKRNPRPLIAAWVVTIVCESVLLWIVSEQPIWKGLLGPVFVIAATPGLVGTWHWVRHRSSHDRREGDRRHGNRRTHTDV